MLGRFRRRGLDHRFEMTRNNNTLSRNQRRAVCALVDLHDRPKRNMIGGRDRLQAVSRTGKHGYSAVPEINVRLRGNDTANGGGAAFGLRCGELKDRSEE